MSKISNIINKKFHKFSIASLILLTTTQVVTLIVPINADATTLRDYDAKIAQQQRIVDEKEQVLADENARLDEATTWYYKNGSINDLSSLVLSSNGVDDTVKRAEYANRVCMQYKQQVDKTKQAYDEAKTAIAELEKLRSEASSRAKSLENAKEIQFPQGGGQPWSGLPYWTGTVARSGCGLCSYTVMIDVLTGNDYTPTDMLHLRGDWKGMDGYPDDKTGSNGLTHAEWTKQNFDISMYSVPISLEALKTEMNGTEKVAIVCARGNSFKNKSGAWRYSSGHFIAVFAHDEQGFHVADSAVNAAEGKDVVYSDADMQRLLSGTTKIVMYSN